MADYYDDGFAVRKASWHAKELLLAESPKSVDEALPVAFPRRDGKPGHWEPVTTRHAFEITVMRPDGTIKREWVPFEDGSAVIIRDDYTTPADAVSLGQNSTGEAGLIHNRTILEIAEAMVQAGGGEVEYSAVGSVKDGVQVFCTLTLMTPLNLAGDDTPTYPFFVVTSGHDGATACRAGYGFIRVVCANTILAANMVWDHGTVPSYTFRHTGNVSERITEAKEAMAGMTPVWSQFQALTDELASYPCNDEMLDTFLEQFVPMPESTEAITERKRNNVLADRGTIRSLYLDSPTTDGHRGTALGLVDSAVEYLDHYRRSQSNDTLIRRTLIQPDTFKAGAIRLAREVCTN